VAAAKRPVRKAAVALGYDPDKENAPKILAAGQGELAEALLRIAQEHNVPVHTNQPLASALIKLDVGTYLPPELYAAVAEVLAFLWRMEQEKGSQGLKGGAAQ
jgi:flagellar biosynthesis protein